MNVKLVSSINLDDDKRFLKTTKKLRDEEMRLFRAGYENKPKFKITWNGVKNIVGNFNYDKWDLSIFNKSSNWLSHFAAGLFLEMKFFNKYEIGWTEFSNFITELNYYYSYRKNPYHNFRHACSGKNF